MAVARVVEERTALPLGAQLRQTREVPEHLRKFLESRCPLSDAPLDGIVEKP